MVTGITNYDPFLLLGLDILRYSSKAQCISYKHDNSSISFPKVNDSSKNSSPPWERSMSHKPYINLAKLWPCSFSPPRSSTWRQKNVGMGKAVFPSTPLRCHLLGEEQHICSCWPPTSSVLPFLSTAGRRTEGGQVFFSCCIRSCGWFPLLQ